ncbi:phospholipase/carboxylesterase [Salinibacter ruber]|uniref:Phospholipase/carboxylesterase n=2 Tax=Salinibacter ruber TaxID=146919 RepID=Q2RYZ7_SALRD|nr:dienelactone hydrolase family protein [Salinibacter ruber]ABC44351.1 phospholipase/carboxylesterase [Salinibacter ruber DSM 13855]MBB4059815.1 phospholipase/carboxylesterase [Salinibacter ruber]MBB4068534.1 phospholipase/carboxylesterase [Salinibacter ruber]MCS3638430.1 phospholipase/carboxylesterase [Salinibacter ruber]MCS3660976.1 phospholipase/carboxylesterase [Salinibacter ruber]
MSTDAIHQDQPVHTDGAPIGDAQAGLVLLHGRGASAQGMLQLADDLDVPDIAHLAPQARMRSWYPQSFMAPRDQNEPELASALATIGDVLGRLADAGIGPARTVLLGFSQGACLATTYAAQTPQRYGGVVGLSGGLIGPDGASFDYEGSLDATPVFLGCSDQDPYIPRARVAETADVLRALNADVTSRIYEGLGHTINDAERQHARSLLRRCVDSDTA